MASISVAKGKFSDQWVAVCHWKKADENMRERNMYRYGYGDTERAALDALMNGMKNAT